MICCISARIILNNLLYGWFFLNMLSYPNHWRFDYHLVLQDIVVTQKEMISLLTAHHINYLWIYLSLAYYLQRSESIAAWMNGLEIGYLRADLLSRELMLNTDISTQFIVAPLLDAQKREGNIVHCSIFWSFNYYSW